MLVYHEGLQEEDKKSERSFDDPATAEIAETVRYGFLADLILNSIGGKKYTSNVGEKHSGERIKEKP